MVSPKSNNKDNNVVNFTDVKNDQMSYEEKVIDIVSSESVIKELEKYINKVALLDILNAI